MTREKLIEALSDMRDYHVVSQKCCDFLKLNLLNKAENYNAGSDFRMSGYFNYLSPTEEGFQAYLDYTAFTLAANLSRYDMNIPTDEQMLEMLRISGYSGEEMKNYVRKCGRVMTNCVSVKHLVPTVCLLSRLLSETMGDKSIWRGYKKGKKKKNYTPAPNESMQKLTALVDYMKENWLLFLDSREESEYRKFAEDHARFFCRLSCIHMELKSVSEGISRRQKEVDEESIREIDRVMRRREREAGNRSDGMSGAALRKPAAPFADPAAGMPDIPSIAEFTSAFPGTGSRFLRDIDNDVAALRDIPPEVGALFRKVERFDEEAGILQEECWETSDRLTEKNSEEWEESAADSFISDVARGAFWSILEGDDIYRMRIGRFIMEDMMTLSEMPLPSSLTPELEDEDEWDYWITESNGKLGLPVIKEGDCLSYRPKEDIEEIHFALPVASLISRYADRPFSAPLYIRKSIIRKFKEGGCSDRRARDYAVIVATLLRVTEDEADDYRFVGDYPEETEEPENRKDSKEEAVQIGKTDERIREEAAAREEAERSLKLARKENQACRHEINSCRREISALQQDVERLKAELTKKQNGGEVSEEAEVEEPETVEYPWRTSLKVVLYGGFEIFHRELLKLLPDVRIVETGSHIDVNPIRNADIVFLQINKTDHSGYYTVCDACKSSGVPYIHLNYASAKRCAGVMVEEIKKLG
ncbi:MAG: DUF5082 domain-containing protein [Lachnospiraceae bacterium]|nr:DUF5082 domain-containing protein [Lachnospiraceae bacterium]